MDIKKWSNGDWQNEEEAVENFTSYFNQHYKPLLDKLADSPYPKIELLPKDRLLLGFLRDDLLKIFGA